MRREELPGAMEAVAQETISHPTDSHPPTAIRIENLGFTLDDINPSDLLLSDDSGIELIEDHTRVEEELTTLQQRYYVFLGVEVPNKEKINPETKLIAALGAHMVCAGLIIPSFFHTNP